MDAALSSYDEVNAAEEPGTEAWEAIAVLVLAPSYARVLGSRESGLLVALIGLSGLEGPIPSLARRF